MWDADRKVRPRDTVWDHRGQIFLSALNNHDGFFFLHIFQSLAFDVNIEVAINEPRSFTLTSTILKFDVICDIALTSVPNVLTTSTWLAITTSVLCEVLLLAFYPSQVSDLSALLKITENVVWYPRKVFLEQPLQDISFLCNLSIWLIFMVTERITLQKNIKQNKLLRNCMGDNAQTL